MKPEQVREFQDTVLGYYGAHGRHDLPWRQIAANGDIDPYDVLVSELMLQQTQVSRVVPKFMRFTAQFPTSAALAAAPLSAVLQAWSGLGYNRRAKFLWRAAQIIQREYGGVLPADFGALTALPGVGANTAGALLAYVYDRPVVFIETNIRTVYIHHFFAARESVSDKEISALVAATLPGPRPEGTTGDIQLLTPRHWYWALMDYGTHVKQTVGNLSALSKHYTKQSAFQGSNRQVRGQVLRLLASGPHTMEALRRQQPDERLEGVVAALVTEGLVSEAEGWFTLYGA